jgi:hypothetical protein
VTRMWAHLLAGQEEVGTAAPRVESVLRQLVGTRGQEMEVNVHPTCGWISMVARRPLATRRSATLLSARDAKSRAEKFLLHLATRLKPTADLPLIFLPPLPNEPVELVAVPHPTYREWNHWLYRTQPQLPTSHRGSSIPVLGSAIEVRVGEGGQIIGFHSRWRPTTGNRVNCDVTPAPPAKPKRSPPRQVYVLEGAAIPQSYLAAYWLIDNGDDFHLMSGCSLALVVELDVFDEETTTMVRANVEGGSGDYQFGWARYDATDPFDGLQMLGAGTSSRLQDGAMESTIELGKSAHQVVVHVIDRQTGAFKHYQQLVVSSPFSKRQEPRFATPDPTGMIDEVDPGEPFT